MTQTTTSFRKPSSNFDNESEQQYRDFYGKGENKYGIFPPIWDSKWGKAPMLGIVYADNEFLAEKLAFDRGFSPCPSLTPFIKFLGARRNVASV